MMNSHTSDCRVLGYTPKDEIALVMHDMHKEHTSIPLSNSWGHMQHFLQSCPATVTAGFLYWQTSKSRMIEGAAMPI